MLEYLCNVIWQVILVKQRNIGLVKKILYMTIYLSFFTCEQRFPFEKPEDFLLYKKSVKMYHC